MTQRKLTRRSIRNNTFKLGFSTLISKVLGLIREIFMARYLGVGPLSDAFFTAFRLPNSLRKIFAEGALTAAFVPTIIQVAHRHGQEAASRLMTAAFLVLQGFLLCFCLFLSFQAGYVISFIAPGWVAEGALASVRFTTAIGLFKILIFFILFVSSSSLIAGALQAVNSFTIPATSQIVMNLLFVGEIALCTYYDLSIYVLAWLILFNGIVLVLFHMVFYFRKGFLFLWPDSESWKQLWWTMGKFIPSVIGMGAIELNLWIDQALASYLPAGSVSLLQYTYGFMRMPLGIFAVTLSTILLSHFSRVSAYAPRRMGYYLLESTKLVFWITIPASILMGIFSYKIFYTTLLSDKFTLENVEQASTLLTIFLTGLFSFSLNKIVLNIYYALHETTIPTVITIIGAIVNTFFNFIGIYLFGLKGIVLATALAGGVQVVLLIFVLHKSLRLPFYPQAFMRFVGRYLLQLSVAGWLLYALYAMSHFYIMQLSPKLTHMLLWTLGYWFWVAPLCGFVFLLLYATRSWFGVKIYFLD